MITVGDVIQSAAEISRDLLDLYKKVDEKTLTRIIQRRSQPLVEVARQIVSRHRLTGMLEKAIAISPGNRRRGMAQVAAGIKGIEKSVPVRDARTGQTRTRLVQPWRYAKFLEHGFFSKLVDREIEPDPFMGPAFDRTAEIIVEGVREDVEKELQL